MTFAAALSMLKTALAQLADTMRVRKTTFDFTHAPWAVILGSTLEIDLNGECKSCAFLASKAHGASFYFY
jgi:hypothetical protein